MFGNGFCGSGFVVGVGHGPWLLFGLGLVLVALVVSFGRGRDPWQANRAAGEDEALALLRRRYAAGEVNTEEFQAMKRQLHS
jgi:uncharacterized membrane protein